MLWEEVIRMEYVWRKFVLVDEDLEPVYEFTDYQSFCSIEEGKIDDRDQSIRVAAGRGFRFYEKKASWEDRNRVAMIAAYGVLPGGQGEVELGLLEFSVVNHHKFIR
jgi:hypothetical protein